MILEGLLDSGSDIRKALSSLFLNFNDFRIPCVIHADFLCLYLLKFTVLFLKCVFFISAMQILKILKLLLGSASGLKSNLLSILDVCSSCLKLFMDSWVCFWTITTLFFFSVGDVN